MTCAVNVFTNLAFTDPCYRDMSAHRPQAGDEQVWLSKEQPGGGTIPLCMCSLQSRGKKVIKETIDQALCVCLSMNIPLSHLLKYTSTENWGKEKKKGFIVFPEWREMTHVWLPIRLTRAVFIKRKELRNKLSSVI